jgi:hypothetical protein
MAYETKETVDQCKYTSGKGGLPTPKELEVDPASTVAFWSADNATASGHDELAPNFNEPFYGKSRGQKRGS